MFTVSTDLQTILRSRSRDLVVVFEMYPWTYIPFPEPTDGNLSYDPRHAIKLFAGQSLSYTWGDDTITYERQIIDGPTITKFKGKQFDTVSLKVSNVDRSVAAWVLSTRIQGMRLVVREIPKSANSLSFVESSHSPYAHSIIRFVGRIQKPDDFNRSTGTLSAVQDLGTITSQIPERDFQPTCPLKFKQPGGDCLGNQTLAEKTPTYQAARICNKTEAQCIEYGNEKYFQGTKVVQVESSFVYKHHWGFGLKLLWAAFLPVSLLFKRGKDTVANSIHDETPYGKPVSVILGRWAKKLMPIQYQDIGTSLNFKMAACRGTIKDFLNIRNEVPGFTQPLGITKHLGEYGGVGTQTQDTVFPGGEYHSKLAYITGYVNGSDIQVEDPAPEISSLVAGLVVNKAFGIDGSGTGRLNNVLANYTTGGLTDWTDNPVDLARFLITDPAYLALPPEHIGELATAITSAYTTGAIKDVSNAERCLLPNTETTRAGVDYKRYNSTGMLGARSFIGLNGVYDREAEYEFFDPDSPPTSLDVVTRYRKRYTSNIEMNEKQKAIDFLYDKLLTCFRGFIRWDHFGRLVVDCERPADRSYLRQDLSNGATSVHVLDVTRWKPIDVILNLEPPLRGKILIGAHKLHSEVRPVLSADYSADGNSISLDASATGSLQVDTSGATLSGGSSSSPASGYVDILGSPQLGDQITITIDGVDVVYTATQEDEDAGAGAWLPFLLACMINADPTLNNYLEAQYGSSPPDAETDLDGSWRVLIYCKYGVLNFTTPLEEDHFAEIADPEDAPVASTSAGSLVAGTYLLSYAYRNPNGNTNISPILAIDVADDEQIDVDAISLPTGADSVDWFVSVEANSDVRLLVLNNDGSAFSIDELPIVTADQEPKRNTTGEEVLRVMMSFAGKALTYADTTRANVLDGSFSWPEGGRQSTINQVKGTYREAIQDFGEQPVIINDERHQEDTGQINTANLDLSAVDNYNQASRLLNGYLAKFRDLDFFFKHGSAGEALLLEINDLICVSDDSGAWRNVPVTIEDAAYNNKFEVNFTNRLYSTSAFDDAVLQTQVPLPSALTNYLGPPPDIAFNTVDFPPDGLVQSTDGTAGITSIRGGAIVGDFIYGQFVNVRVIKRAGVAVNETVLSHASPDSNGELVFEFPASADGLYTVELEVCSMINVCNTTKPTADIVIGFGTLFGIAKQGGILITKQGGTIMEQPHN